MIHIFVVQPRYLHTEADHIKLKAANITGVV